jgi:hypothetical protein
MSIRTRSVFVFCDLLTVSQRVEFGINPSLEWMESSGHADMAREAARLLAELVDGAQRFEMPMNEDGQLVTWASRLLAERTRSTLIQFDLFVGVCER